jgi:hypothetical protein
MTDEILRYLAFVESLRAARLRDPVFAQRVTRVKAYQQLRFTRTYADLLASERYSPAATFFLAELYGPGEFGQRDAQFARVVPKLSPMLPAEVMSTVRDLARLHAISESLDSEMARHTSGDQVRREDYVKAWQRVGQRDQRELQLQLVLDLGKSLDALTRRSWIIAALRLMRGPAHAAGLSSLQLFLESGMSSFRSMRGAAAFLEVVRTRESRLIDALFAVDGKLGRSASVGQAAVLALSELPHTDPQ